VENFSRQKLFLLKKNRQKKNTPKNHDNKPKKIRMQAAAFCLKKLAPAHSRWPNTCLLPGFKSPLLQQPLG